MDPQQSVVYAKAHDELRDLFHEIARHGRVTAHELQHSLLPFTAGDAKRDLQELVEDMKRKQLSLDEPDFIRALWKKMYLSNVVYTTQQTGAKARPASAGSNTRARPAGSEPESAQAINIPIAHVIVSIKRRAQLKQFANYYASRGISGADHLSAASDAHNTDRSTPRHLLHAQKKRQAAATAAAQAASISTLRGRTATHYDVVVSCYDNEAWCMKTHVMFSNVEMATAANCSRLHCVISTKEHGTIIVGSRHFIDHVRARAARLHDQQHDAQQHTQENDDEYSLTHEVGKNDISQTLVAPSLATDLSITKLDDLGLRNIVALAVGRGSVVATTERRVHCWKAIDSPATIGPEVAPVATKASSPEKARTLEPNIPIEVIAFLEDEGDCFGHVPLLKRAKTVGEIAGIRRVSCGDGFAIGVTAGSELYAWGSAPLGRGKSAPTRLPFFPTTDVSNNIVVSRVVCGLHHVLLLESHGSVFAWGSNVHGQLGVSLQGSVLDADVHEPMEVKLPSVVLDVACGDHHSVVLTDKGMVFAWGNNWHGQLGLDPTTTDSGSVFVPTKVNWWNNRARYHGKQRHDSVSSMDDEESFSPDRSHESPGRRNASSPTKNTPPRVYLLTAIGDTTAIVTEQGQVFMWGKCVPPGPFAGACGIVAKWLVQRVETTEELHGDQNRHSLDATATATPLVTPWTSISIANGLVVLVRQTSSAATAQ